MGRARPEPALSEPNGGAPNRASICGASVSDARQESIRYIHAIRGSGQKPKSSARNFVSFCVSGLPLSATSAQSVVSKSFLHFPRKLSRDSGLVHH
jgi:hypothetical protein